ncbi:hypothetical protein PMAYCL1PPCAC_04311, partial [Pristionchus mayeri]
RSLSLIRRRGREAERVRYQGGYGRDSRRWRRLDRADTEGRADDRRPLTGPCSTTGRCRAWSRREGSTNLQAKIRIRRCRRKAGPRRTPLWSILLLLLQSRCRALPCRRT